MLTLKQTQSSSLELLVLCLISFDAPACQPRAADGTVINIARCREHRHPLSVYLFATLRSDFRPPHLQGYQFVSHFTPWVKWLFTFCSHQSTVHSHAQREKSWKWSIVTDTTDINRRWHMSPDRPAHPVIFRDSSIGSMHTDLSSTWFFPAK